ncbi:hypothetical protein OAM69_06955, partial [bacterium]|nr:hypothetical protein [bacterium]
EQEQEQFLGSEQEQIFAPEKEGTLALEQEGTSALEQEKVLALEEQEVLAREGREALALEEQDVIAREEREVLAPDEQDVFAPDEQDILVPEEHNVQKLAASAADVAQKKSAICLRNGITRIVELRAEGPTGVPCSVDYIKPDEDQPEQQLWVARNDANYCLVQFESFLKKLEDELNWSCQTQVATTSQSSSGGEKILPTDKEQNLASEQEKIFALEEEEVLALEQERIRTYEQERNRALEQERVRANEQERNRALEEEKIRESEEQEAQGAKEAAVSTAGIAQKVSAVCRRNEITRIVELHAEGPTGLPCSVDYIKPDESLPVQRLWVAYNDANYCVTRFESFLMKLEDELDWSCEQQEVTQASASDIAKKNRRACSPITRRKQSTEH